MGKSDDKTVASEENDEPTDDKSQQELHFVVALKRSFRNEISRAKMSSIEDIDGVRIQGDSKSNRVHAFVHSAAVSEMKERLGEICFVEPVLLREPTKEPEAEK